MFYLQNYFGDPWNAFDFVIVLGSLIDIGMAQLNVSSKYLLSYSLNDFVLAWQ